MIVFIGDYDQPGPNGLVTAHDDAPRLQVCLTRRSYTIDIRALVDILRRLTYGSWDWYVLEIRWRYYTTYSCTTPSTQTLRLTKTSPPLTGHVLSHDLRATPIPTRRRKAASRRAPRHGVRADHPAGERERVRGRYTTPGAIARDDIWRMTSIVEGVPLTSPKAGAEY